MPVVAIIRSKATRLFCVSRQMSSALIILNKILIGATMYVYTHAKGSFCARVDARFSDSRKDRIGDCNRYDEGSREEGGGAPFPVTTPVSDVPTVPVVVV